MRPTGGLSKVPSPELLAQQVGGAHSWGPFPAGDLNSLLTIHIPWGLLPPLRILI